MSFQVVFPTGIDDQLMENYLEPPVPISTKIKF